jgi:hypothetical protein
LDNYQGNSNKDKEPPKKEKVVEKVITGEAVLVPKGIGWKFKHIFLGGTAKQAGRYVVADLILPSVRTLMWEIISKGSEKVIFGESSIRRRPPVEYGTRYQYNSPLIRRPPGPPGTAYYQAQPARIPDQIPYRRDRRDMNNIVLPSREEADLVVERLIDVLDKYEVASLADLYNLLGLETQPIDNKWGWTYLNNVEVRQVREGYLIELPVLEEI